MEPSANYFEVEVPRGATVWQIKCEECKSNYGVIQKEDYENHPIFCVFCAHRAAPLRIETATNGRL